MTETAVFGAGGYRYVRGPFQYSGGAARAGLTWHYARPPVGCLDYEMDVRGVSLERMLRRPG
jgi:hypothetical protein